MLSQAHNSFIIGGGKEQPTDLHPCLNIVCETVPREMRAAPSLRFCPPPSERQKFSIHTAYEQKQIEL